jgi:hypothetical protein
MNEHRNFKLAGTTRGSGLARSEEDWKRRVNWSINAWKQHKGSPWVAQTSKNTMFFIKKITEILVTSILV